MMVLDAVDAIECDRKHFRLRVHGLEVLKAVISNDPYPMFWIDTRDGEGILVERLMGVRREFSFDDTKDFLRAFIDETDALKRPFIENDGDERYSVTNPTLADIHDEVQAEATDRNYRVNGESDKPAAQPAKPPKAPSDKIKPAQYYFS